MLVTFCVYYRFTPEAKADRDPLAWIPFGFGPRNCIGMRLAKMELKIAMIKILQNFKISISDQTEVFIMHSLVQLFCRC